MQSATTGPPGPVSPRALIERATHKSIPPPPSHPQDNLEGADDPLSHMTRAWPTRRLAPAPITPMEPRAHTSVSLLTPNTCPPVPHRRRRGEGRARGQESEGLRSAGSSPGTQSRRCLAQLPVHEAGDKHGREWARKESVSGQAGQGEPSTLATLDGIRSAKELILSLMQVCERLPVGNSHCHSFLLGLCGMGLMHLLACSGVLCACARACRPLDFLSVTCLLVAWQCRGSRAGGRLQGALHTPIPRCQCAQRGMWQTSGGDMTAMQSLLKSHMLRTQVESRAALLPCRILGIRQACWGQACW